MGDLNDDPLSPSVTKVIKAVGSKDKVERGGMYNPWVDFYKGIGTLAYNDPGICLIKLYFFRMAQ